MLCKGVIIAFISKERFAAYAGAFVLRPDDNTIGFAKFALTGIFSNAIFAKMISCIPNIYIVFARLGWIFVAGRT